VSARVRMGLECRVLDVGQSTVVRAQVRYAQTAKRNKRARKRMSNLLHPMYCEVCGEEMHWLYCPACGVPMCEECGIEICWWCGKHWGEQRKEEK